MAKMTTTSPANATCTGNPSFQSQNRPDVNYVGSQIPGGLHGYICRTPPFGTFSCPRFHECCGSQPFQNITSYDAASPFAPASCVSWCAFYPVGVPGELDTDKFEACMAAAHAEGGCEMTCEWICQPEEIQTETTPFPGEWCSLYSYSEFGPKSSSVSGVKTGSAASTTSAASTAASGAMSTAVGSGSRGPSSTAASSTGVATSTSGAGDRRQSKRLISIGGVVLWVLMLSMI